MCTIKVGHISVVGVQRLPARPVSAIISVTSSEKYRHILVRALVPAILAADERFEWSTNVPHAHYRCDSHCDCAAMRALQQPVSPTTELLNDVGAL